MIILLANRWDEAARALAQRWAGHGAALLTADDLSLPGWSLRPGGPSAETIVVAGQSLPLREVTAVLTLTPGLIQQELFTIAPADRTYVASEMNAFLLAWLARLRCPVLNRPTPTALAGPHWRRERWASAAARSGIPVQSCRRFTAANQATAAEGIPVAAAILTVIGDRVFAEPDKADPHPTLARHARTLARAADVDLLAVRFSSPESDAAFLDAETFPSLTEDSYADAVLSLLQHTPNARQGAGA